MPRRACCQDRACAGCANGPGDPASGATAVRALQRRGAQLVIDITDLGAGLNLPNASRRPNRRAPPAHVSVTGILAAASDEVEVAFGLLRARATPPFSRRRV